MKPLITVVIPTYRRLALLRNCLEALAQQQLPTWATMQIIVVSDGPDPAVTDLTDQLNEQSSITIQCLQQPRRQGPAAARNRGWRAAISPFIAFTDDDCLPQPNWLLSGLTALSRGAQVVTGRVKMPLPEQPTYYERTAAFLETAEFVTANLFCRRDALALVDGFDERFDQAWREDSDLHFKLLEARIPISVCPEAVVIHPVRPAPWYATLTDERKNRYDALLYKRHPTLFRQRIPTYRNIVLRYYAAVLGLMVGLLALGTGHRALAVAGTSIWAILVFWLVYERLPHRAVRWQSLKQAVLTSLATPFLSIYWRLHGAFTYKTWYW